MGQALSSLHVGSRVGVSLDSDHCLHLHVDGQRQGMVARDVPQPCYALFDLWSYKITQVFIDMSCLLRWLLPDVGVKNFVCFLFVLFLSYLLPGVNLLVSEKSETERGPERSGRINTQGS